MRTISIALFLILPLFLNCDPWPQETDHQHEEHKHHIGFLIGSVYNISEEKYMLGLGFKNEHVLPFWNSLFRIGIASEVVFDEHRHYVISAFIPVHPTREITLFVAPGIMFIDKEEIESRFAIYIGENMNASWRKFSLLLKSNLLSLEMISISCWVYISDLVFRMILL